MLQMAFFNTLYFLNDAVSIFFRPPFWPGTPTYTTTIDITHIHYPLKSLKLTLAGSNSLSIYSFTLVKTLSLSTIISAFSWSFKDDGNGFGIIVFSVKYLPKLNLHALFIYFLHLFECLCN